MKKYIVILVIPLLFACGRAAKEKAMELQARNDSLMNQTSQKDLAINDFMKSVNDIQGMLDTIKAKQQIISHSTQNGEMKVTAKDQILNDISSMYALMLKDKHEMDVLSHKLKTSGLKLAEFQKMVDHLQQEIAAKDNELSSLRDRLEKMNIAVNTASRKIDTLSNIVQTQTNQLTTQSQTINEQTTALNTAYYIMGTSKQLKEEKIIKGGKILPDFNRSLFTKVDIRDLNKIPVQKKKAILLSNHPSTSFKLNKEGKVVNSIEVTDEKSFWSNTKYLVVVTD